MKLVFIQVKFSFETQAYVHDILNITTMVVVFVKPEKNLIFLKNNKNNKIVIMVQGSLKNSLDLR